MAFLAANTADERKALAAVELLVELTSNITNSPTEAKFRTIRSTTPKIAATIFALPGAPDELAHLGSRLHEAGRGALQLCR